MNCMMRRLSRIERKCDMIIILLRDLDRPRTDIDTLIDSLHRTSRKMLEQCEYERKRISDDR